MYYPLYHCDRNRSHVIRILYPGTYGFYEFGFVGPLTIAHRRLGRYLSLGAVGDQSQTAVCRAGACRGVKAMA